MTPEHAPKPAAFCRRCGTLSDALRTEQGLVLCPRCEVTPPCAEYHHTYLGAVSGPWQCIQCGQLLASTLLRPGAPPDPSP